MIKNGLKAMKSALEERLEWEMEKYGQYVSNESESVRLYLMI